MWTPKRIILLAGGFLFFTLIYLVYSLTSLGRINTLPPLPEQYRLSDGTSAPAIPRRKYFQPTPLELKLEQAFGNSCKESKWPFLFELSSKNMVIAAVKCEPTEDGRIHLAPMSLALFGKKKNDGRDVEINTLRCNEAYITFDRPVPSFSPRELDGRKLVEAELFGDANTSILITNNRRTKLKEDDLIVRITNGPLYYIEKTHLVRTSDTVHIQDGENHVVDGQLIPPKAVIAAKGMEMELTTSSPPRPGVVPSAKLQNENISGVKRIVLKEAVDMTLYVAGGGPFPGANKASGAASAPGEEQSGRLRDPARPNAAKSSIVYIKTPGRFEYQLFKDYDTARFDVPADAQQLNSLQDVTVDRINGETGNDMLVCKRLDLRLKRRNDSTARRDVGPSDQGIEIETAHATGPYVTITSDSEKLDAHGTDFFYDAGKKLTILKGTPRMEANKEDSLIQAPEMRIQEIPLPAASSPAGGRGEKGASQAAKTYQQVQATGPGEIHMLNKKTGKRTVHAYWKDKLLSTRDWSDKEAATRDGGMDLLILDGSAEFIDKEHDQSLKAETLKVWLLAEDKKPQPKAEAAPQPHPNPAVGKGAKGKGTAEKDSATASQTRRPHRIEALRNVLAHSPDMNIHDAARLVVHITDVPFARMPPPSSSNGTLGAPPPNTQTTPAPVFAPAPRTTAASSPSGPPSAEARKPAAEGRKPVAAGSKPTGADRKLEEEKQPIDLTARSIEAKVLRCEERMALDHLWAEGGALDNVDKRGGVIVRQEGRQEPGKPKQEGVYIEGNTLDMSATAKGNKLHVTGDLARLKMDKIFILGPEVTIDQVENKAWVDGEGAMQMYSDKTLDGKPLKRPVPLTIHWSQSMVFFGTCAEFYGSIQAEQKEAHDDEQKDARLACQHLQVRFDRPISLKAGMHGDQPAKVSMLVADKGVGEQDVRVEDQLLVRDRLEKYQLLMGREIHMTTVPRDDDGSRQPGQSNDANEVRLYGPGTVRLLQRGAADLTVTPGQSPPNGPARADRRDADPDAQQVMKLTYITFEKQMRASSRTNVASFWEAVRVLNLPCNDPHLDIDLDAMLVADLPVKAMYLRCNVLKVSTYQRQVRDSNNKVQNHTYQEMDARGQVYVQGREFTAQCDHMTFNEEKDQVIFYGDRDNVAVLSRTLVKGDKPDTVRAKTIIYYRSTGRIKISELGSYDG